MDNTTDINQEYINDLCSRLITRSNIRKGISSRKSVQEGKEDRLCSLLEEAAVVISKLQDNASVVNRQSNQSLTKELNEIKENLNANS